MDLKNIKIDELLNILNNSDSMKKFLTEKAREDIAKWIDAELLPLAAKYVNEFNNKLIEQSENETGWFKIRDAFFIPICLRILVWFFTQMS